MRLQLALDVSDIDEAVDIYSKLFGAEPVKRRPGCANFAIENPPLKLVLFETPDHAGGLNRLGVETETWAVGPDGARWQWYVKTSDKVDFGTDEIAEFKSGKTMAEVALGDGGACCG